MRRAVLDTNVFVAAGFRPGSACAGLLAEVREGRLALVWNDATLGETRAVLHRIPRLNWPDIAPLFDASGRFGTALDESEVSFVVDPGDRKFAALSLAAAAPLVSSDDHLLAHRGRLDVWAPGAFLSAAGPLTEGEGPYPSI